MSIGEEFMLEGKKYRLIAIEGNQAKLKCLWCGGKIVYKNVSKIPA
jgi:DNA-directed RNA polymerase subunit RPC12/RpoP